MVVRRLRVALVPLAYVALATVLVSPGLGSLGGRVVGDNGDSMFNLWVLDWVWHHSLSWHELWRGQMFQPHPLTLAYSDILLPQAVLAGLLRSAGASAALAFNLVSIASWAASLFCCDRLLRRFTSSPLAAAIGSIGWTFSTVRLGHLWHFQLVTAGVFIPLVLSCLLWFLDAPSARRGVVVGLVVGMTALAASYYGLMIAVAVALVIAMHVVAQRAAIVWRKLAVGLAAAGAVTGVLLVPVWLQYERLQRNPHFRRTPDPSSITDWRDYLTPASISRSLPDAPILGRFRPTDVEHQLFIGVVLGILAVIGLVVVVLKHREVQHRREALMLVAVGLVMLLLSGGDRGWLVGIDAPAPFRVARAVLSPFDGIRAPARFAVLVELAIAVLAVIALDRIAARSRRAFAVVAVVALCGIAVEARVAVPTVRLPDDRATTAVNHTLDRLPRGLTVELPIVAPSRGVAWPFIEAPRQYLARIDDQPRVNGYSGFDSPGFEAEAATLNTFPSAASIELMHRLGVRYVVLRHDPVGHLSADQRAAVLAQLPQLDGAAIDAALRSRPSWLAGSGRVGSSVLVRMATSRSS